MKRQWIREAGGTQVDKRAILELRGRQVLEELINAAGGLLCPAEVAHLPRVPQEDLAEESEARGILSIKVEGRMGYPAFQFGPGGELLPHFAEIMALLDTDSDIAKLRFFFTPNSELNGTAALALGEGRNLDLVRRKAKQFGKQVAR